MILPVAVAVPDEADGIVNDVELVTVTTPVRFAAVNVAKPVIVIVCPLVSPCATELVYVIIVPFPTAADRILLRAALTVVSTVSTIVLEGPTT